LTRHHPGVTRMQHANHSRPGKTLRLSGIPLPCSVPIGLAAILLTLHSPTSGFEKPTPTTAWPRRITPAPEVTDPRLVIQIVRLVPSVIGVTRNVAPYVPRSPSAILSHPCPHG
jgi:hypothetical protein